MAVESTVSSEWGALAESKMVLSDCFHPVYEPIKFKAMVGRWLAWAKIDWEAC